MSVVHYIIVAVWIAFLGFWVISARHVKRTVRRERSLASGLGMMVIFAVLVALSRIPGLAPVLRRPWLPESPIVAALAAVLCIGGVALAIMARRALGANWSAQPSLQEGHELVTSGPYRHVRHPIYTGILLAILGSVLTAAAMWLVLFVAAIAVFVYRIKVEEALMRQQFPDRYPAYQERTRALIPLVW
jgi:protein-S-isoprenylcysteine O-methyltransferase Ste14